MTKSSIEFHTPGHEDLFNYLCDKLPQFVIAYYSPEICPKGFIEIFVEGIITRQIAHIVINFQNEATVFPEFFTSRKNLKLIKDTVAACPKDYRLQPK